MYVTLRNLHIYALSSKLSVGISWLLSEISGDLLLFLAIEFVEEPLVVVPICLSGISRRKACVVNGICGSSAIP